MTPSTEEVSMQAPRGLPIIVDKDEGYEFWSVVVAVVVAAFMAQLLFNPI